MNQTQKAFTIIELVVVMAITAVSITLAIAGMSTFRNSVLVEQASMELLTNIRQVQNMARNSTLPADTFDNLTTLGASSVSDISGWALYFESNGGYSLRLCREASAFTQQVDCSHVVDADLRAEQFAELSIQPSAVGQCRVIGFSRLSADIFSASDAISTPNTSGNCDLNVTIVGADYLQRKVSIDLNSNTFRSL